MCREVVYDPATAEYICLDTGEVFGDRIVDLLPLRDWQHYSTERLEVDPGRVVEVARLILHYAEEFNVSGAAREEALRLAKLIAERNFWPMQPETIALMILSIAARNVDDAPVTAFCRKLKVNCRKFAAAVVHMAERLGVKLKEPDASRVIVSYVNRLVADESVRGEIARHALELYEKAKAFVHASRANLAAACLIYAMRQRNISVSFEHAADKLNLSLSTISYTYRRLRELIEKGLI